MSKFKRVLILTMALTMMITASVGCSSNVKVTEDDEKTSKSDSKDKDDDKDSDEEDDKESDEEDEDEDKDSDDEDEDDDKDSDDSDKEDEDSDDEDEKPKKKKESKVDAKTNYVKTKNIIEGTDPDDYIICDKDGVVVKLVEINGTDATEFELVYEVENNSDGEIHVSDDWATLNGIQTSSSFWAQLEPGESEKVTATFSDMEGYERYFDTEIGDVTYLLTKYLITDEDYETIYDDYLIIYPDGEENAEFYRRDIESSDELIASNDYVDIYMLDAYADDIYGYCTDMYIVNNSDKEVYIETDNETVNGEEITSLFGVRLGPGECAYGSNDWFGDEDDIEIESGDKVKIEADLLVEDSEFEELDVTELKISTEY